jgi:hypothetical protein
VRARTSARPGSAAGSVSGRVGQLPAAARSAVTGGALLALATSLRARGLRGLDVLRRSQDRAPPPGC